jgi:hypothetical protein
MGVAMLEPPVPILNTQVKQHWALIVLGWEALQGNSGSAGTPKGSLSKASIGCLSPLWFYLSKKNNMERRGYYKQGKKQGTNTWHNMCHDA